MNKESQQKFSIRKLTIGTVSMGIGAVMFANAPSVQAETQTESETALTETTTQQTIAENSVDSTNSQPVSNQDHDIIIQATQDVQESTLTPEQSNHDTMQKSNREPIIKEEDDTTIVKSEVESLTADIPLKNGLVVENGTTYYYENNVKIYDQVVVDSTNQTHYYVQSEQKYGAIAVGEWVYHRQQDKWYNADAKGQLTETFGVDGYYKGTQQQFDTTLTMKDRTYYFKSEENGGKLAINEWVFSPKAHRHYGIDTRGRVRQIASEQAYYIDGQQQYNTAVTINDDVYYYGTKAQKGTRLLNDWGYERYTDQWYKTDHNGRVVERFGVGGYFKEGAQQFDTLLNFKNRQYYFQDATQKGKLAINKKVESARFNAHIESDSRGKVYRFLGQTGYYVYQQQQFDTTTDWNGVTYYYKSATQNGVLAKNGWTYSRRMDQWHYSGSNGAVLQTFGVHGYFINGRQQFDRMLNFKTRTYYFQDSTLGGKLAINKNVYSKANKAWYKANKTGHISKIQNGPLTGVNSAIQNILNKYVNKPYYVYYESLDESDHRTASLRGTTQVYGASAPKTVILAYIQDRVQRGLLSWDDKIDFNKYYKPNLRNDNIYYGNGGTGSLRHEADRFGKKYTVGEVVERVTDDSDNLGTNLLLAYAALPNKADFDRFTRAYMGRTYSQTMSPKQLSQTMKVIYNQHDPFVMNAMDKTAYDNTKIDVLPANTYQKIGEWRIWNHATAIVKDTKPFTLTFMTDGQTKVPQETIASITEEIYVAHKRT